MLVFPLALFVFGGQRGFETLRTELQLRRQLCCAAPLYVLGVIAGALVLAAHNIDGVFCANIAVGDTFQLGDGGDAPVGGLLVAAEGERLDVGEENSVAGLGCLGACKEGQQSEEGEREVEMHRVGGGAGRGVLMECCCWPL